MPDYERSSPQDAVGLPFWRRPHGAYTLAIAGVVGATLLRAPFEPWLQGRAPYGLYFPVLLVVTLYCGVGPTLVAAVLSLLASWFFFVPPAFSFAPKEEGYAASLVLFALSAGVNTWLARAATSARRAAEHGAHAERRAQESRARLAAIVESSDDAIIGKDLDGIIQSWNAAAERLYGYHAAEMIGRSITAVIPPERHAEEERMLALVRRGEKVDHFETVRVAKDGRRLEVSVTISPIRDAHGEVVGASKIARDVTERRRAERALAQQREWFRVTLSSIGDAVIATDIDGRVVFMNQVAEHMTGWRDHEAQGRACADVFRIVNEATRDPVESPIARVLRDGLIVGLANHTVLIHRDGSERPIDDSAAPIRGEGGKLDGVVLVFHDVSERRKLEHERTTAAREREQLLHSERAARSEAERANRLKDDFVATLSHELRTPLNAILGWTEILRRSQPDAATLDRGLAVIERNTRVQAQLISDLFDVSRIVSGKLRLDLQLCELGAVIDEAIDTIEPAARVKGVTLERQVERGLPPIAGDPARLAQVVWNLLSNAVKFTGTGGRVSIRVARDGSNAAITVSDSGAGIRPDFLPYLFDRFRQADASITRRFGGLGLGLTIVKQLVDLHGGTISAHSDGEGHGSTFVIKLRLDAHTSELDPRTERRHALGSSALGVQFARLEGLRVMVVEDEPDARDLVQRLLTEAGCQVTVVASAAAAMEALARERCDVLISDIGLPDEDGYSLIERIRRLDRTAGGRLPAIALTAFARSEDRTRALRAGFQAHVAKPVEPAELLAIVASLADIVSAGSPPAPAQRPS